MKKYISQTLQTVIFSNTCNTIKTILARYHPGGMLYEYICTRILLISINNKISPQI